MSSDTIDRELDVDIRHLKRGFHKAVGRSLCKILAEIITNSDDSYKRLERDPRHLAQRGSRHGEIIIRLDRPRRLVQVLDNAEGLTFEDMDKKFPKYGRASGDRAHRYGTRSLFGKGLRDVLFTQERGNVRSIKGGQAATSQFRYRTNDHGVEKPSIRIRRVRLTPELRNAWCIAENGTLVEFELRNDVPLPQHAALAQTLSNFYMLRLINSSSERTVRLTTRYKDGRVENTQLRYSPPKGTLVCTISDCVTYQGVAYPVSGQVFLADVPLKQAEAGYDDREGGLLVTDEDGNVLDLTLFGYDGNPHAARIFGTLQVTGLGSLIESRLNAEVPEELLTETRDGFDRGSSFYRALQRVADSALKPVVDSLAEATAASDGIPAEVRRRHRKAFDQLNQLYRRIVGGPPIGPGPVPKNQVPPADGLAFERQALVITQSTPTPIRLLLNLDLLRPDQTVVLTPSSGLQVFPSSFTVLDAGKEGAMGWKVLKLLVDTAGRFSLTAQVDGIAAVLDITAVPEEVEVQGPMWFSPSRMSLRPGQSRSLILYVNLTAIPEGSKIAVRAEGSPDIKLPSSALVVGGASLGFLYRAPVRVTGGSLGAKSRIEATWGQVMAAADVEVTSRPRQDTGQSGFFQDYRFKHLNDSRPAYLADDGWVEINLDEPLNRVYFGETKQSAEQAVVHLPHAQLRLADLVLDEALWMMVMEAYDKTLKHRVDPVTDIRLYVLEQKAIVGPGVYECFVNMRELGALMALRQAATQEVAAASQP